MISTLSTLPTVLRARLTEEAHRHGWLRASAYIMEFPKCGGSWVRNMLRDVVAQRAADRGQALPPVLHGHWRYTAHVNPAIYVIRDGRDVVVSLYFYHLRHLLVGSVWAPQIERYFERVLGPGYDVEDVRGNLPAFIASLATHPFGGILRRSGNRRLLPWPRHIADWAGRPGVLIVRYEDLLQDAAGALDRIATHVDLPITPEEAAAIADHHSFEAVSGRRRGVEDRTSFQRKGVAGDWRNHFTHAAGDAFAAFGGPALVSLGYASDDGWLDELPIA